MSDFGKVSVEMIRARLETRVRQIEAVGAGATTGFLVGRAEAERKAKDDLAAGRTFWTIALRRARSGLQALKEGNPDLAIACLLEADQLAIDALGGRLRPDDLRHLAKPAGPRGRPKKTTG